VNTQYGTGWSTSSFGIPDKQRALVLQGGGTLGAYESGVLKILCKKLMEEDKENKEEYRLLLDVIVGTSIGAMNAAILVSQFFANSQLGKSCTKTRTILDKTIIYKKFRN